METLEIQAPKRKLTTLVSPLLSALKFGDFILMQEYEQLPHDGTQFYYRPAKPVLGVVVGLQIADQTVEMEYVPWQRMDYSAPFAKVRSHIEWHDYADFLGHWHSRPTWREILAACRKRNTAEVVASCEIDWKAMR
jgi:hypothetical protein